MDHVAYSQRNTGDLFAWFAALVLITAVLTVIFLPAYLVLSTFLVAPYLVFYGPITFATLVIAAAVWKFSRRKAREVISAAQPAAFDRADSDFEF
jgi:hypothetical protein